MDVPKQQIDKFAICLFFTNKGCLEILCTIEFSSTRQTRVGSDFLSTLVVRIKCVRTIISRITNYSRSSYGVTSSSINGNLRALIPVISKFLVDKADFLRGVKKEKRIPENLGWCKIAAE